MTIDVVIDRQQSAPIHRPPALVVVQSCASSKGPLCTEQGTTAVCSETEY